MLAMDSVRPEAHPCWCALCLFIHTVAKLETLRSGKRRQAHDDAALCVLPGGRLLEAALEWKPTAAGYPAAVDSTTNKCLRVRNWQQISCLGDGARQQVFMFMLPGLLSSSESYQHECRHQQKLNGPQKQLEFKDNCTVMPIV